jgi:hypothetical protein
MHQKIEKILKKLNQGVLNDLMLAQDVDHPAEGGRARENVIYKYIRKIIPNSFGISTGFILDTQGQISKQIDIIIYRTDYHPIFEIGGINHFFVESVVAIIEVKSSIRSVSELTKALENIKSVKIFDRSNQGKNYVVIGSQMGFNVNPDDYQHQIFGAIITENSLSIDTLSQEIIKFLQGNPKKTWPNLYVDVNKNVGTYIYVKQDEKKLVTTNPYEGNSFGFIEDSIPLIEFAGFLCNFLRIAPKIDYSSTDYLTKPVKNVNLLWKYSN